MAKFTAEHIQSVEDQMTFTYFLTGLVIYLIIALVVTAVLTRQHRG